MGSQRLNGIFGVLFLFEICVFCNENRFSIQFYLLINTYTTYISLMKMVGYAIKYLSKPFNNPIESFTQ